MKRYTVIASERQAEIIDRMIDDSGNTAVDFWLSYVGMKSDRKPGRPRKVREATNGQAIHTN